MIDETTQGPARHRDRLPRRPPHVLEEEIHNVGDIKGLENPRAGHCHRRHHVPGLQRADGAHAVRQRLHSLQTGVVDVAEKASTSISSQALRGGAGCWNITEHEANNALVFISDKLWQSFRRTKQWC